MPTEATTLTIPALVAARRILAIVPEARKAEAVERALLGPITEDSPASILRRTTQARLYLDADSALRLDWREGVNPAQPELRAGNVVSIDRN